MAEGSAPDITQQLLQMQSMIAAAGGNNGAKGIPLLAGLLPGGGRDADVTSGVTLKGKGFNADGMINRLPQGGKPKLADKFLQAISGMGEDFKKMAQSANVMYTGDLPNGSLPGAPAGGGSFVENLGPRGGGTIEMG